jgi:hypothetical protein
VLREHIRLLILWFRDLSSVILLEPGTLKLGDEKCYWLLLDVRATEIEPHSVDGLRPCDYRQFTGSMIRSVRSYFEYLWSDAKSTKGIASLRALPQMLPSP